tara:strand:- start:374 stop:592 length:219 start_codon:yes stop_codon:yes gene_type:complete
MKEKILKIIKSQLIIGKLYRINTKNGKVEKYLHRICKDTGIHYFVSGDKIEHNLKGTAYNLINIEIPIKEIK